MSSPISFVFFGTGVLAESTLAELVRNDYIPKVVITKPDAPQGRHMVLTSPHIKTWAEMKGIPVLQPENLDETFGDKLRTTDYELFIVASYGKIIPENILNIPKHGTLNVHPSLLPEYRGPSPIESALLDGKITTGVTIIKLDSEIDHGPILVQTAFPIDSEATAGTLEVTCGQIGGHLLSQVLAPYVDLTLIPKEQDHTKATFTKKIEKSMGEISLSDSAQTVTQKYKALTPWPGIYFFHEHKGKNIRVKVTKVDLNGRLEGIGTAKNIILSVIPEGKHEMSWEDFVRGYMKE
jgi:methionyl-tRNA formyltransferase